MQTGSWRVLGLMSGSSLDGLDLCLAVYSYDETSGWSYVFEKTATINYPEVLSSRLFSAHQLSASALYLLEGEWGGWVTLKVQQFLEGSPQPQLISTHGHTIFHQPANGFTVQLAAAPALAAALRLPVVYDFRSADVALGGQGAPLVPLGDELLFRTYDACLNLGGIANISYRKGHQRVACDLGYCNMLLNHVSSWQGLAYDEGGSLAASGRLIPELLAQWNAWPWYQQTAARSLGREGFEQYFVPTLQSKLQLAADVMHSWCEHLAQIIGYELQSAKLRGPVLITGGGAYHRFLIERIEHHSQLPCVIPEPTILEQKESLIFGFLGLLRYLRQPNVWSSVTGSTENHCAGSLIELFA